MRFSAIVCASPAEAIIFLNKIYNSKQRRKIAILRIIEISTKKIGNTQSTEVVGQIKGSFPQQAWN